MDAINWILTGLNGILLVVCGFIIVRYWDRSERTSEKTDDEAKVKLKELEDQVEKNKEHISTFRLELGVLTNDVVNKVQAIKETQERIERQVAANLATLQSIEAFLRDHLVSRPYPPRSLNAK